MKKKIENNIPRKYKSTVHKMDTYSTQDIISKNLNEWQLISFELFDDEQKEIDVYITLLKDIIKSNAYLLKHYKDIEIFADLGIYADSRNRNLIHLINKDINALSHLDHYMLASFSKEEAERNEYPSRIPLIRYNGPRINFEDILNVNRGRYSHYMLYRMFLQPYVYPNILDSLSKEAVLSLAEIRYPERRIKFLQQFKKNNTIIIEELGENIAELISEYIQPSVFLLTQDQKQPEQTNMLHSHLP